MRKKLKKEEVEKEVLRSVLIESFKIPRFDTLQEYLRQRAGINEEESQEIRYQVGAMDFSERIQYICWKEHVAEQKRKLVKGRLSKVLVKNISEERVRWWFEVGESNEDEMRGLRKSREIKINENEKES